MKNTITKTLPCSVGEKLYLISNFSMRGKFEIEELEVETFCIKKENVLTIHFKDRSMYYSEADLGVVLFADKEEAKAAAEKWDGNDRWIGKRGI